MAHDDDHGPAPSIGDGLRARPPALRGSGGLHRTTGPGGGDRRERGAHGERRRAGRRTARRADVLLSLLGGAGGALLGYLVTGTYATTRGWPTVVPLWVLGGGVAATVLIGAVAGLDPAIRAARPAPAEALAGN